jgi:hypothetical protein
MKITKEKYWVELAIPWNLVDVKNARSISDDVFTFAASNNLGYAVTRSILTHVLMAAKNNNYGVNIETLKNIHLVVGNNEPRTFSGVLFEDGTVKLI